MIMIIKWLKGMLWWEWVVLVSAVVAGFAVGWATHPCEPRPRKEMEQERDQLMDKIDKMSALLERAKVKIKACQEQAEQAPKIQVCSLEESGMRITKCIPKDRCEIVTCP